MINSKRNAEDFTVISIDREVLVKKVDEAKAAVGAAIHDGVFIVRDIMMADHAQYTVRLPVELPAPLFIPYKLLDLFEKQSSKTIEIFVKGETMGIALVN